MRPRWRKVLSDLWGNKIRSLLVIASIAVGLFAAGLIANTHLMITADMEAGYRSVNPANIQINTSGFDDDLVKHIRRLPGVRQAEGVRSLTLRAQTETGDWKPIELTAMPDIAETQINKVNLKQGIWPPDDRQIVIDHYKLPDLWPDLADDEIEHLLEDTAAGNDRWVVLETPSGKKRSLQLVGVVNDQTIGTTSAGGFFLAPIQGYVTLETLEWLEYPTTMNVLLVTVDENGEDESHLRQVANHVIHEIEGTGRVVYSSAIRASDDHPNRIYVQAIASVLFLLGFMVVFLSGFLITNTLQSLLNQQIQQIGVMKTIGARQQQIIGIYMVLIFAFGLIAFLIAMPLASRVAYWLIEYLGSAINVVAQGYRIEPMAVILQLVIALIVPQAAGFMPILHGTRISAIEAMSSYSSSKPTSRKSRLDAWVGKIRGLSRPLLVSLRNIFRRKGRLFMTLFTLTLGGAIFIATFNVQRSLALYVERIGRYFMADINLSLQRNYRIDQVQEELSRIPGIAEVEGWAAAAGKLALPDGSQGESLHLLAPPAGSRLVDPIVLEGRWVKAGDKNAIVVNERFRETFPDLQVNDTIQVEIGQKKEEMLIVGFFQLAGKSGGYVAYTTYEYLSNVIGERNKASAYRIIADRQGLTLEEQKQIGDEIETRLKARGFEIAEITAGQSLTATTSDGLDTLTAFLLIMASLIAMVGSIGLSGTMSMNVLERTREIGIMRAIGASDRAIMSLVMVEGMLIGLMSWFFGTLVAFPISTVMSNAINMALFGAAADFTYTPTGVILWLIVVVVLSILASVIPARNAARLTIREVLAYE